MSLKTQLKYMFFQTFHESDQTSENHSLKQSLILGVKCWNKNAVLTDGCHSIVAESTDN